MRQRRLSTPARLLLLFTTCGLLFYLTMGRIVLAYGMDIAAEGSDFPTMRLCLLLGGNINYSARDLRGGGSPLLHAAMRNHTDMAAFLLERGANPDIQDNNRYTPLIWATMNGNQQLARLLLQYHARPNITERCRLTAYDWAQQKHFPEIAEMLHRAGGRKGPGMGCG